MLPNESNNSGILFKSRQRKSKGDFLSASFEVERRITDGSARPQRWMQPRKGAFSARRKVRYLKESGIASTWSDAISADQSLKDRRWSGNYLINQSKLQNGMSKHNPAFVNWIAAYYIVYELARVWLCYPASYCQVYSHIQNLNCYYPIHFPFVFLIIENHVVHVRNICI